MNRATLIRIAIFWTWIATLLVGVAVYFAAGTYWKVNVSLTLDCVTKFVTFLLPSIGVMGVFFFQLQQEERQAIETEDPALTLAAKLGFIYNFVFWCVLLWGIAFLGFGDDLLAATDNALKLMGLLGFFSTAPITYLFAVRRRTRSRRN